MKKGEWSFFTNILFHTINIIEIISILICYYNFDNIFTKFFLYYKKTMKLLIIIWYKNNKKMLTSLMIKDIIQYL